MNKKVLLKILDITTYLAAFSISIYVLFFRILSFDGAMHTQYALNLIQKGQFISNYDPGHLAQIKIPFQLINGAILKIFGSHLITANLANIFFYILFFIIVKKISKIEKAPLILISFITISISLIFLKIGFGGYGELPVLTMYLWGVFLIIYSDSNVKKIAGTSLIALAMATKTVMILAIPSLLIIAILLPKKSHNKTLLYGGITFLLVILINYYFEYHLYSINLDYIRKVFADTVIHSIPKMQLYSSYTERLGLFFEEYIKQSGGPIMFSIRAIMFFIVSYFSLKILKNHVLNNIDSKNISKNIDKTTMFFVAVSSLAIVYIIWWIFISQKPWFRRILDGDILLILSASILPSVIKKENIKATIIKTILIACITTSLVLSTITFYNKIIKTITTKEPIIETEKIMKTALERLPANYVPYGYGWWQAPLWSFLANKTFENLYTDKNIHLCLEEKTNCFIFFEPENELDKESLEKIYSNFVLEETFSHRKYSIKKIKGLN